ncbi:DUF4139 domain-containing protein [Solitalea sp. MAHUQ-68]|uniref:DUF4139 domain-containing protein n=1 Tax=Solitalea agri TaxID=2953739 RepID=A0A9X2JGS4_9SPHI|nr:DUF4139 domain-containing protein [Solitalea agri]MCO4294716.1 DUF4139 domain-containing protein [Solitalea agri]
MRIKTLLTATLIAYCLPALANEGKNSVNAKLQSAMILRVGAEVTHTAKATLTQGSNELWIEGLSSSIEVNSLQIKCSGGVTVMSSAFSTDYLTTGTPLPNVKKLQDSIDYYGREKDKIQVALKTNDGLLSLLKANKSIGGTQTGLSVAELMKMMDYYKAKSTELENEKSVFNNKLSKISESIARLQLQIDEESRKNDKSFGRLKLQLSSPLAGTYDFTVSYYTNAAYWIPYYDLQASSADKPVKLTYKAKFVQTTGLDWKKVKLTLSTSTPGNGKTAPELKAWFLEYAINKALQGRVPGLEVAQNTISYEDASAKREKKYLSESVVIRGTNSVTPNQSPLYVVNGQIMNADEATKISPETIKDINVLKDASATALYGNRASNGVIIITLKEQTDYVSESENSIDVTYDIDLPYDILGSGNEQSVTLKSFDLPAEYKYYSAPKMDKNTYLLATVTDWEKLNLLPGEANITFEGTYIGKSYIDPLSTQKTLNLTLGNDKRVIVKREKMQDYSSTKFIGSEKKQVFTYKLTVKNTKNSAVKMILKDQYPLSTQKDIEVELVDSSKAHVNSEVGTLTWEFELKPGETREFILSYAVRYPKDQNLNL